MIRPYDRAKAITYANKWANSRNPIYYNFDSLGGDCTNFVSQCLYAGCAVMNYSQNNGWYYNNVNDRAPSWTGVEYLYEFLTDNKNTGPFATRVNYFESQVGDVITLFRNTGDAFHTVIINRIEDGKYFVSSHTRNGFDIPLDFFSFSQAHFLHIEGVRN